MKEERTARVRRAPELIPQHVEVADQPSPRRVAEHDPEGPLRPPHGAYRPVRRVGPASSAERAHG